MMIATCNGGSEVSDPSVAGTATFDIGLSQIVYPSGGLRPLTKKTLKINSLRASSTQDRKVLRDKRQTVRISFSLAASS
jgi:hypothetical protein